MTVLEIVAEYLRTHGYDGLCNADAECGCVLEDLAPCGEMCEGCEAGMKVACSIASTPDGRPACDHGHAPKSGDWHIEPIQSEAADAEK